MVRPRNKRAERRGRRADTSERLGKNVTLISFKAKDIKQRWLITTGGCPTCEQLKHDLRKEIKTGVVKITDVGDEKGFEIISELSITEVPIFIVELNDETRLRTGIKYIIDE